MRALGHCDSGHQKDQQMPQTWSPCKAAALGPAPCGGAECAAAGAAKPEGQGPDPDSPLHLDTRPPTSAKQRCYQLTWQATPDRLKESNEEVVDFLTLSWRSQPRRLQQREESPGPFPKDLHRPAWPRRRQACAASHQGK